MKYSTLENCADHPAPYRANVAIAPSGINKLPSQVSSVSALLLNYSATMIFQISPVILSCHTMMLAFPLHCIIVMIVIYSLVIIVQVTRGGDWGDGPP